MTDESAPSRAPGHRDPADRNGVRTYRGRTVEELIPRIRAELGPDAIILREREGLTGGIGGFFAQRCVEIDAQAAPRLSVYDDDFDEDDEEYGEYAEYDEDAEDAEDDVDDEREHPEAPPPPAPEAAAPPPSAAAGPARPASSFLDEASFAARLEEATFAADDTPAPEPPAGAAPSAAPPLFIAFDELGEDPETPSAETSPPTLQQVIDLADIEHTEPAPEPAPAVSPEPTPAPAAQTAPSPRPTAIPPSRLQPPPDELAPDPKAPWMAFAAEAQMPNGSPVLRPPAPPAASAAPPPFAPPPAPNPSSRPAERAPAQPSQAEPPPSPPQAEPPPQGPPAAQFPTAPPPPFGAAPGSPAPTPPAPGSPTWPSPAGTPNPGWPAAAGYGARRRSGLLPAAERMLRAALEATAAANERRNLELQARAFPGAPLIPGQAQPQSQPPAAAPAPSPAVPAAPAPAVAPQPAAPPAPPTPAVDAEAQRRQEQRRHGADLERRLTRAGISSHRAAALVAGALSRRGPSSTEGELAEEIRRALVAALPVPHTLPKYSAIAIVGAGGSGKTRCVAALASAYSGAGVDVSVASFGGPTREDELGELLHGESVNVIPAMRTRATARAVSSAREHSLVIIDTASATPGDDSTIDMIAEALHSFRLDAIYLAVPATLSLPAALKLVDSFSAFDLAGMVATHVDETDQLGMIAELSMQTGIPVVYTHTGLHLQTAIASADAEAIATSVL